MSYRRHIFNCLKSTTYIGNFSIQKNKSQFGIKLTGEIPIFLQYENYAQPMKRSTKNTLIKARTSPKNDNVNWPFVLTGELWVYPCQPVFTSNEGRKVEIAARQPSIRAIWAACQFLGTR